MDKMKSLDKYRGCLIGGAAGDALGMLLNFLMRNLYLNVMVKKELWSMNWQTESLKFLMIHK